MAMKRGLHVISAVLAVMTLEEADRLKRLKENTGLRYMMAETSYYRQPAIYARDLFREGAFGELCAVVRLQRHTLHAEHGCARQCLEAERDERER
jgi:predicted dehydrogenase